jgi:hypothetical protein
MLEDERRRRRRRKGGRDGVVVVKRKVGTWGGEARGSGRERGRPLSLFWPFVSLLSVLCF